MSKTTLQSEITKLLDELCVELGFCLSMEAKEKILSMQQYEAEDFTRNVFEAEGMSLEAADPNLYRKVKKKFTDSFGSHLSEDDFQ